MVNDELNLANLSILYRISSLSKALKLSINEFLSVTTLTGINTLAAAAPSTPKDTLLFANNVKKLNFSGFSISELDYILRHRFAASTGSVTPSTGDDSIALILREIREGLQRIKADTTLKSGVGVDLINTKLTSANWENTRIELVLSLLDSSVIYSETLNALPLGLGIAFPPKELKDKVFYGDDGGSTKKLRFKGIMTQNEKVKLKNLAPSTETDYQTAVDNLFRAPRTFIINQILAMLNGSTLYVVPLSGALPSSDFDIIIGGLKAFRGKAGINQSSGEFYFLGEMTQTEKTTLLNVSGNPQYQAPVNVLFNAPRTKISEDLQQATQNDKDLEYFLQHITEYLRQTASESFVKQKLGEVLKLDAEIVKQVLTIPTYVYNNIPRKAMIVFRDMLLVGSDGNDSKDPITPTTHSDQFISFRFLEKVTRVISRLKITANEIPWLFQKGPDIGWLDLARLPLDSSSSSSSSFAPLERIVNTIQLRDNLPLRNESGLFYLFDKVMGLNSSATDSIKNTTKQEFLSVLSKWSSWSMDDLESLIGKKDEYHDTGLLDITFPDDYKNELMLLRLQSCFMMMKRLGVSAKMLSAWNKAIKLPMKLSTMHVASRMWLRRSMKISSGWLWPNHCEIRYAKSSEQPWYHIWHLSEEYVMLMSCMMIF